MSKVMLSFIDTDLSTPENTLYLINLFADSTGTNLKNIKIGTYTIEEKRKWLTDPGLDEETESTDLVLLDFFKIVIVTDNYEIFTPLYELFRRTFMSPGGHYANEYYLLAEHVAQRLMEHTFFTYEEIPGESPTEYGPSLIFEVSPEDFKRYNLTEQLMK